MIDYGLIFITGLLASLHCLGMCGPIVLAYSTIGNKQARANESVAALKLHAAYNAGRITSYVLLGVLAGLLGIALGAVLNDVAEVIAIIGGAVMIIAGIGMLGFIPLQSFFVTGKAGALLRKLHGALLRQRTLTSKFALGLLTPLLPCGMLYAMFAKASTSGSVASGALTMATFGIGIVPALMLMGSLSSFLSLRTRKSAEQLAAFAIILMGVILLMRGFHVPYLSWLSGNGGDAGQCH
jgi:sulfite exporter TauE/SafE